MRSGCCETAKEKKNAYGVNDGFILYSLKVVGDVSGVFFWLHKWQSAQRRGTMSEVIIYAQNCCSLIITFYLNAENVL